MKVDLDILMLVLDIKREIAAEEEIRLFNSIIISESLYLTSTGIDEGQN